MAARWSDEEFTEILRAILQELRDINRRLRGHDPYTPEPPPRDHDGLAEPEWLRRRSVGRLS